MNKRALCTYILGFALIVFSLINLRYSITLSETIMHRDIITIIPTRQDSALRFDSVRIKDWANSNDSMIVVETIEVRLIESHNTTGLARMSTTSQEYFSMVHLPFVAGAPWRTGDEQGVILCIDMAWSLFGAIDVVNLPVRIGNQPYTVIGVVENVAEADGGIDGFAWVLQEDVGEEGIIYLKPATYDPVSARLEVEALLYDMEHDPSGFIITDSNAYIGSIALRGNIFLALLTPVFIFAVAQWLYKLTKLGKSKASFVLIGLYTIIFLAVSFFLFRSIVTINLWLPQFVEGYNQLLFNSGMMASRSYLTAPLAALVDVNERANMAFWVGIVGLLIICMTRFLVPGKVTGFRC